MSFSMSSTRNVAPICAPACAVASAPAQVSRLSLSLLLNVWAERRALARMDETRLADMGLTAADVARETTRPIWDLPRCRP